VYFGILVLEQVVNVALSKRRFQIYLGLAVNRLAIDYVAWCGRSLWNIGTGNDLLYPQGLSTRISDVRISVLVLDSIVNDVARIVDT
jgi:hypothetical protein